MNFTINDFEGPLDLLLHLVKSNKMDIETIKINVIIDQYLNFIDEMDSLNIDVASEYLVMASDLVHLKSCVLINKKEEETDDFNIVSEDDLKNKLAEYEKYKLITSSFKDLQIKRSEILTKSPEVMSNYIDNELKKDEYTVDDLILALNNINERLKYKKPLSTKVTKKELSIGDKINLIREKLVFDDKLVFSELIEEYSRNNIVVTFLAILEMAKSGELLIKQDNNFNDIYLERNLSCE